MKRRIRRKTSTNKPSRRLVRRRQKVRTLPPIRSRRKRYRGRWKLRSIRRTTARSRVRKRTTQSRGRLSGRRSVRRSFGRLRFRHHLSVVVTCRNEQRTLPGVLRQLRRLPFRETIVVINGSSDQSLQRTLRFGDATVVWLPEPLGHDVGRAIGARIATSDILLFVDADLLIRAEELVPFLRAVDRGTDVALNDVTPYVRKFADQDQVTQVKTFLNRALGRRDLAMNSMTAVPHAVSRRLIDTVGYDLLSVPPKAQAEAIIRGLRIEAPGSINVFRRNRRRVDNRGHSNQVAELVIGDHLEALAYVTQRTGVRGSYPDEVRRRDLARGDGDADEYHHSVG